MLTQPQKTQSYSREEDLDFLQSLYIRRYRTISCMVQHYLHNAEDAADVTSELFLTLMDILPTIRQLNADDVLHYLRGIARNLVMTHLRRKKSEFQAYGRVADIIHIQEQLNADAQYLACCTLHDVKKAILQLPPQDAEVLQLHIFNQLSCSEIGARLHIQDASVRRRLSRARKRLRMVLDNEPPEHAEKRSRQQAK